MDKFFPPRATKRKSTDLPGSIRRSRRRKIVRRCKIYRKEGKSEAWKFLKKTIKEMIKTRKTNYVTMKKQQLTSKDANRSFFWLVISLTGCLLSLIRSLQTDQIPITKARELQLLSPMRCPAKLNTLESPNPWSRGMLNC